MEAAAREAVPVGCREFLADFLPSVLVSEKAPYRFEKPSQSIGEMKSFYGNFLVVVRALTYLLTLGKEGIPEASQNAVLNANYLRCHLKDLYPMAYDATCMHEFVMSLSDLKKETGISAMDIAKGLLDHGIHPPTMYFPLIVDEALMAEPTETESRETLDEAIGVFRSLYPAGAGGSGKAARGSGHHACDTAGRGHRGETSGAQI